MDNPAMPTIRPPTSFRAAVLDIGSVSIRLLVVRTDPGRRMEIEFDQGIITRLMSGLTVDSVLTDECINRSLDAITSLVQFIVDRASCRVRCIGTQALRHARNADSFMQQVERISGIPVEVISADREGRLAWRGSSDLLDPQSLLMDLGGGSTELVFGDCGGDLRVVSLPIGASRPGAIPRNLGFTILHRDGSSKNAHVPISRLVCLGGTATTVAFMTKGIERWTHGCVHGVEIGRRDIEAVRDRVMQAIDTGHHLRWGIEPGRLELLPSGIQILLEIMTRIEVEMMTVSEQGIRFGLVREMFESDLCGNQAAL